MMSRSEQAEPPEERSADPRVEGISAVTLATRDMARAVDALKPEPKPVSEGPSESQRLADAMLQIAVTYRELILPLVIGASALFASAASAAPLSNGLSVMPDNGIENVRLVCDDAGRCYRTRGGGRVIGFRLFPIT